MKQLYFTLFIILNFTFTNAQSPFITTWEVESTGDPNDLTIEIPTFASSQIYNYNYNYNYTVDFGDGTVQNNVTDNVTHTYANSGVYNVSITGDFPGIYFWEANYDSNLKIKSVAQWGDIQWKTMTSAFMFCSNLTITAIDAPDLSQVTNMMTMFFGASSMNSNINNWDVSNVSHMEQMFYSATSFNQPLNNWDVSNVTNMYGMFYKASHFNQPLDNWDVSNVSYMDYLFAEATDFNQPIGNWDVSNVTNMRFLFYQAHSFNQDLSNWDVSNVTNMWNMFLDCENFNSPLNTWDVSNVTNMQSMFRNATNFNQPLNNWNTSSVTNLSGMFANASSFNQPLNNWDVSNATSVSIMFSGATAFNQDISSWQFATNNLGGLLNYSGIDTNNYDLLLLNIAASGAYGGNLGAENILYCSSDVHDYIENTLGWILYQDAPDPACTGNSHALGGTIYYDENNNGCNSNDNPVTNAMVSVTTSSDSWAMYSYNGQYITATDLDELHTVALNNLPNYYTASPASVAVDFTVTDSANVNFCLNSTQDIQDLSVTMVPLTETRPGFNATYQIIIENVGTQTIPNATLSFTFDDTLQSYVAASLTPTSIYGNQLTFDLPSIAPLSIPTTVEITLHTSTNAVMGESIEFTPTVYPLANDATPTNNTRPFTHTITASLDPNDKQVAQGTEITLEEANDYLDYIVRFQNTGTASATFVRIADTLDSNLDWDTFVPLSASHNYTATIKNGNVLEFMFDNINLPDSTTNEAASHGYIAYKVKPKTTVQYGDTFDNTAYIYFDYNPAVVTNTVATEIMAPMGLENVAIENKVSLYPNPASNAIYIKLSSDLQLQQTTIYNLQGQKVLQSTQQNIPINSLATGIYMVEITTSDGVVTQKLVKK